MRSRLCYVLAALAVGCTNISNLTEPSCRYAVSPVHFIVARTGGGGTISVSSPGVCPWDATGQPAWVTFTGPTSGSGNGSVSFLVAPNPASAQRAATLTIARIAITIEQP